MPDDPPIGGPSNPQQPDGPPPPVPIDAATLANLLAQLAAALGLSATAVGVLASWGTWQVTVGAATVTITGAAAGGVAVVAGVAALMASQMTVMTAAPSTSQPLVTTPGQASYKLTIDRASTPNNIRGTLDGVPVRLTFGPLGTRVRRVLIKSVSADLWWNHQVSNQYFGLADQSWNSSTGAFDGTLWELWDARPFAPHTLIKSPVAPLYVNHQVATRRFELSAGVFNPATRDYDGTLWEILDAGNGNSFIKSPFAELYVNHLASARQFSLADQRWDPTTGAYDGTLWQLITI